MSEASNHIRRFCADVHENGGFDDDDVDVLIGLLTVLQQSWGTEGMFFAFIEVEARINRKRGTDAQRESLQRSFDNS